MNNLNGAAVKHLAEVCAPTGRDDIDAGGVGLQLSFNRAKIEENHELIKELLDQLPDGFHEGKGGGLPVFKGYVNRDGLQWTFDQRNIGTLFCLGAAAGYVVSNMPREMSGDSPPPGDFPCLTVRAERGKPGAV